jgi:hypothetical protein
MAHGAGKAAPNHHTVQGLDGPMVYLLSYLLVPYGLHTLILKALMCTCTSSGPNTSPLTSLQQQNVDKPGQT